MNRFDLEKRTKIFALRGIEFVATLPHTKAGEVVEFQLVKAGTSIGANYREANRAQSRNDFIHKIGIVEKESSESLYWWNCVSTQASETPREEVGYCKKPRNC